MTSARLRGPLPSIAQATALAVASCFGLPAPLLQFVPFLAASPAAATSERDFTEDDVNAAVKKVIDERSHDSVFVFRDPKLNADLHLIFDRSRSFAAWKAMAGSRTFPRQARAEKKYAIDFWFKPDGKDLKLMDIRVRKARSRRATAGS